MTELLPPLPQLLIFAMAALALNVTPGADMTFVAAAAARNGARAGIAAALGVGAGCIAHIIFAVAGLSALIAASQTAFTALKWLGAAYLLYLAWQALRAPGAAAQSEMPVISPWRAFRDGVMVNVLNPKVGMFFLAFLPQFIDPRAPGAELQIAALGLWFNVSGTLVNMAVAVLAVRAARRFGQSARARMLARWITATVLGGLALRLVLSRQPGPAP